ncbi:MAG TPA: ABC transporter permease [Nakamurella sp.]|nr:ABC transporter permease [Nakamurella sp.]
MTAQTVLEPSAVPARRIRFLARARRSPWALRIGLGIVAVYLLVAIFAPLLAPYDPLAQDVLHSLAPPSAEHLLGTDGLGRDMLSRLLYGARIDLLLGGAATGLALLLGTVLGLLAGYFRGWVDLVLSRLVDMMMAIPGYPLLVLLLFILGQSTWSIIVAFAATGWVSYARLTRGQVMVVREQDFVVAARLGALGNLRVMARHVLPNVTTQVIVLWASDIVLAISAIAALGYLGIGIQAPTPEWGVMVADGQGFLLTNWLLATAPGLVIVVLGIGLALISDSLAARGGRR